MAGADKKDFVDYYEVLQISPRAELETIKRVFKLLAVRVHPDNPESSLESNASHPRAAPHLPHAAESSANSSCGYDSRAAAAHYRIPSAS